MPVVIVRLGPSCVAPDDVETFKKGLASCIAKSFEVRQSSVNPRIQFQEPDHRARRSGVRVQVYTTMFGPPTQSMHTHDLERAHRACQSCLHYLNQILPGMDHAFNLVRLSVTEVRIEG